MIIVSDTTPLSELAKIGKLDLLQAVFGRVIIPQQVYVELTTGNHPAVLAVKLVLCSKFVLLWCSFYW
jgi:predicted nucleic acid-binding protein